MYQKFIKFFIFPKSKGQCTKNADSVKIRKSKTSFKKDKIKNKKNKLFTLCNNISLKAQKPSENK